MFLLPHDNLKVTEDSRGLDGMGNIYYKEFIEKYLKNGSRIEGEMKKAWDSSNWARLRIKHPFEFNLTATQSALLSVFRLRSSPESGQRKHNYYPGANQCSVVEGTGDRDEEDQDNLDDNSKMTLSLGSAWTFLVEGTP